MDSKKIELGDEVKDKVSGFKGVVIGWIKWIHGCDQLVIQPKVGKDGKLPDSKTFDVLALKVVRKAKKVKKPKVAKGGPRPEISPAHTI
jgi:hypothetical protein